MEADLTEQQKTNSLAGETISLTGTLASLTRADAVALIESHGGEYRPRVGPGTTLVVVGNQRMPLRKNGTVTANFGRALRLQKSGQQIDVLTEDEFLHRLGLSTASGVHSGQHTLGEVSRLVGVSRDQLRHWVQSGLVRPVSEVGGLSYFDFREVVTVKSLWQLRSSGVSTARLRNSLQQLQSWLPEPHEALSQLDNIDGQFCIRREDGRLAEINGQLLMEFEETETEPEPEIISVESGLAESTEPNTFESCVLIEESGDLENAAEAYRNYLLAHGPDAAACYNLANVLQELGETAAAIERYRQAVELDPDYVEAWNNLADLLASENKLDSAIVAWKRALAIDSQFADAIYNLADALQSAGRTSEAQTYWKAFLQHEQESEYAQYARSCLAGGTG